MFDMKSIGRKIAQRRKELNLTQVELADQLLVSYQAVSQWELGKSMPEISNLTLLAEVLDLPLNELLGQKESQVVSQVTQSQPLSDEDLVESAPFIKPKQLEQQLHDRPFKASTLISLAPFLESEKLRDYVLRSQINLGSLVAIAPFLDSEDLSKIVLDLDWEHSSTSGLVGLAPFLTSDSLFQLIQQLSGQITGTQLIALAPFLKRKQLSQIIASNRITGMDRPMLLTALAPFVSPSDLAALIDARPEVPEDDVEFVPEVAETDPTPEVTDASSSEKAGVESILEQLKQLLRNK